MTNILLVDDYKPVLEATKLYLESRFHDVKIYLADNEEKAIEIINSDIGIDVIITDLMMIKEDGGINVLEEAKKKDPLVMVIIMTAYEKKLNRSEAFELGAFDCIVKANNDDHDDEHGEDELYYKTKQAIELRKTIFEQLRLQRNIDFFKRYFDPRVLDQINKNPGLLTPAYKRITIVFWDIRNFSSLCDKLKTTPEIIHEFLADYFETASKVIFRVGGVLDKFIGDGIMALFGTFEDDTEKEKNAIMAVTAAKELRKEFHNLLAKHRKRWIQETADNIDIGIACSIHTDKVIVGNLGMENRDSYTAIGHGVNLSARIEKHAKKNQILLSGVTNDLVKKTFVTRQLPDPINDIKGISGEYYLYEVLDSELNA